MRELLLVRHGEAECNQRGTLAGHDTCRGLTERGHGQAAELAARLLPEHQARPVLQLHTSSVRRARETAAPLAALLGLTPVAHHDLRVPDPGPNADGQPWEALRRVCPPDPGLPERPLAPGGEPWRQYLARAGACLTGIMRRHPGDRVIVVGHSETITAALILLLGHNDLGAFKIETRSAGVTRLQAVVERPGVPITAQRWALTSHC